MTDPVDVLISGIAALGLSLLFKASVVLAAAWLVSLFLKRRSAALRHILWSVSVAAVAALPLLSFWMPSLEVDLRRFYDLVGAVGASDPAAVQAEHLTSSNAASAPATPGAAAHPVGVSAESARSPSSAVPLYMVLLWGVGAAILFSAFACDLVRIVRITRSAVAMPRLSRMARAVAAELGMGRHPRTLFGDVETPLTWGLFRPVVILPASADAWSDRKLRIVLRHELAHVRRLDYLPHVLSELACFVYWPNPLVWFARHRLQKEQELACDDVVLRAGTASHDYAELLLDIARSVRPDGLLPTGIRMADRAGLKRRIRVLLDPTTERDSASVLAVAVVVAAVTLPALSAAALRSGEPASGDTQRRVAASSNTGNNLFKDDRAERRTGEGSVAGDGTRAFTRVLEAEQGNVKKPMAVYDDDQASGGRFVMVRDQDGYDAPQGGPGRVTFLVDIPAPGIRAVWARVIGDRGNDNSFYVSADGDGEIRWDVLTLEDREEVESWTWLPVLDRDGRPVNLAPGTRTVTFRNREDGTRLDALFLTSDPDLIPQGRSPLPPPMHSVSISLEAEAPDQLVAPMEIRADNAASGRLYVAVADGFDSTGRPPADGRAVYHVDVPRSERYVLWGRVRVGDDDDDSFWIRANGEEWVRWNGIGQDVRWNWQLVHNSDDDGEVAVFPLHAGINTLEVAYREDGARLDRLLLTNNMYVHPSAPEGSTSDVTVTFNE